MAALALPFVRIPFAFNRRSVVAGALCGLLLGTANLLVIILLTPALGGSFRFLAETPHARAPFLLMFPFGIFLIAIFVELLFRGFVLEQLLRLLPWWLAIVSSALFFALDPFLVATFRFYHWLAFSDGLVWGALYLRRGLISTISAHAVEVWIVYLVLKIFYA